MSSIFQIFFCFSKIGLQTKNKKKIWKQIFFFFFFFELFLSLLVSFYFSFFFFSFLFSFFCFVFFFLLGRPTVGLIGLVYIFFFFFLKFLLCFILLDRLNCCACLLLLLLLFFFVFNFWLLFLFSSLIMDLDLAQPFILSVIHPSRWMARAQMVAPLRMVCSRYAWNWGVFWRWSTNCWRWWSEAMISIWRADWNCWEISEEQWSKLLDVEPIAPRWSDRIEGC